MTTFDSLAPLLLLALAALPLVASALGIQAKRWGAASLVAATVAALLFAWFAGDHSQADARATSQSPDGQSLDGQPIERAEQGYVSSQSCRACHPRQYETWYASFHRTMTQRATEESVVAPLEDEHFELDGLSYRLFRHDGKFLMRVESSDPHAPGAAPPLERPIVMTTGSHHMQSYWISTGDSRNLGLVPFAYLIAEQRWIPSKAGFLQPPHPEPPIRPGLWNHSCIRCHVTAGQPHIRLAADGSIAEADSRVAVLGISCEACHGPAEEHVALNRDPLRRYGLHLSDQADDSIVNPLRLAADRASHVCGQCHGISVLPSDDDSRRWLEQGFAYRPGDDLNATRVVVGPRTPLDKPPMTEVVAADRSFMHDRFWSDGMVRVSGRELNGMIESPCFQHGDADRRLSCLSCHEMHPHGDDRRPLAEWTDDQLKPTMRGNAACADCHRSIAADSSAHSRHQLGSSGDQCMNCHMPYTTFGLQKAIRSHQIDSPSVATSLAVGRPNACNLCHLDQTLGWTADYLQQWHGQAPPQLSDDERSIAASILWLLKGDAGQRALIAWNMGRREAQDVSRTDWMAPLLIQLLDDPYDAIRLIAYRTLRGLSGFETLKYDFVDERQRRLDVINRAMTRWHEKAGAAPPTDERLLFDAGGNIRGDVFQRLLRERDERPINLKE